MQYNCVNTFKRILLSEEFGIRGFGKVIWLLLRSGGWPSAAVVAVSVTALSLGKERSRVRMLAVTFPRVLLGVENFCEGDCLIIFERQKQTKRENNNNETQHCIKALRECRNKDRSLKCLMEPLMMTFWFCYFWLIAG